MGTGKSGVGGCLYWDDATPPPRVGGLTNVRQTRMGIKEAYAHNGKRPPQRNVRRDVAPGCACTDGLPGMSSGNRSSDNRLRFAILMGPDRDGQPRNKPWGSISAHSCVVMGDLHGRKNRFWVWMRLQGRSLTPSTPHLAHPPTTPRLHQPHPTSSFLLFAPLCIFRCRRLFTGYPMQSMTRFCCLWRRRHSSRDRG